MPGHDSTETARYRVGKLHFCLDCTQKLAPLRTVEFKKTKDLQAPGSLRQTRVLREVRT
jgi:hypothetical protein